MRKLVLLFLVVMSTFAVCQSGNSHSALVIRQDSNGVISIQKVPNPNLPNSGVPSSQTTCFPVSSISNFYNLLESNLVTDSSGLFHPGQMMVIWENIPGCGGGDLSVEFLRWVTDDPTLTGPYLAYTSSMVTAENTIKDAIYKYLN